MTTFVKISSHTIPVLQATVEQYLDPASGVLHIHMDTAQPELVFLVAFPTVPQVSDGRAHILEHLALCGSDRYPVRNPFFSMLRRSTATFMNAMTYADRTVYPFASTDKKDFFNLLDVYLDAAFFPRLDYLNFLQEGWRYGLDGDTLQYQGVVFNEMKGAFNSPMRALDAGIAGTLFKGTTYGVESGGDPLVIPELTHAMLKEFHATHYHPSQAVFMTTGRIDASEIQQQISERVLSKLPGSSPRRLPELAPAWTAPKENTVRIPSQEARDDEYGIQFAWLMGEAIDQQAYYRLHLLSAGLLGDSSAPLMKAMESAGYGRPSSMNGRDAGARQMVFHIGMEGLTEAQVELARARLWSALEQTAIDGIPTSVLQAALRDIKYSQRKISSGHTPYGLSRLLHALPMAMYGGDVMNALDNEAILETLAHEIDDPAFFKGLVQSLIDSPTRLTTRVIPDAEFFTVRKATEEARLAAHLTTLSSADRERIQADSAALEKHQQLPSNSELLPRILPGDVSPLPRAALPIPAADQGAISFSIASNGISYANVLYDVSHLSDDNWPWLQLYTDVIGELGVGERDFEATSAWRQRMVPAFHASLEAIPRGEGRLHVELSFSASGLREEQAAIASVLSESITSPRFDEAERVAFLIQSLVQDKLTSLAESGSHYASLAASAPLSALRRFSDITGGMSALPFYRRLQELSKTPAGLQEIADQLGALHQRIVAQVPTILCAGIEEDGAALAALLELPTPAAAPLQEAVAPASAPARPVGNVALHATSQINHCVIAWSVPGVQHADAAALAVAAELLSHQILHQALREQGGAYGGYASYAANAGVFSMSSYRDPRLAGTYADFAIAIDQLLASDYSQETIEEAIICVIKGLDKPHSPYAEALTAWNLQQRGITAEIRLQFRTGVLNCSAAQVKAAVQHWLKEGIPSRAAFAGNTTQELAGLEVVDLVGLAS
ncbi:insulinase family protein [Actimicrobium antarcticum]|uniref:Insulinase family protein n=1 Tax=Actimicrobium antarcticum TaxID=1051899 RepID=A0ABP7T6C3_9BURK